MPNPKFATRGLVLLVVAADGGSLALAQVNASIDGVSLDCGSLFVSPLLSPPSVKAEASATRTRSKSIGIPNIMRRSTSAASFKIPVRPELDISDTSQLQYCFGIAGDGPAAGAFLALLFDESAIANGELVREFTSFSQPTPVSFLPLIGFGPQFLFQDAIIRRCEGFIYVFDVDKGSAASFRQVRKRIGAVRDDIKVALVAFSSSKGSSALSEEAETRTNECKILAGNYGCTFATLGITSRASSGTNEDRAKVAETIVEKIFDEIVGTKKEDDSSETPKSETLANNTVARSVELCVVGDLCVGKTTLIQRLIYEKSLEQYLHTDQTQTHRKRFNFKNQNIKLQIVDTPPEILLNPDSESSSVLKDLFERTQGWILVYSVRNLNSFRILTQLLQTIQSRAAVRSVPIMVVGTNSDELIMRTVRTITAQNFSNSLDLPFLEINGHSDLTTLELVLQPLLTRVLSEEKQQHLEPKADASSTKGIQSGMLHLHQEKETTLKSVELRKDLLVYRNPASVAAPMPQSPRLNSPAKDERRFSGIFSSVRRRNSLRNSSNNATPEEGSSPTTPRAVRIVGGDDFQTLFLCDCICTKLKTEQCISSDRFGFRVVDAIGKQLAFEADTADERDRWIYSIRKAGTEPEERQRSDSLINSGTLGRKRGKTFNATRTSSTTSIF